MTRFIVVGALLASISIWIGAGLTREAPQPATPAALPGNRSCSMEDLRLLNRFAAARERYASAYRASEEIAAASGREAEIDRILTHGGEAEKTVLDRGATQLDEQMHGLEVQDNIMDQAENDGDACFGAVSPGCRRAVEAKVLQILTTTAPSVTR
jgi:hypothetical protein